MRILVPLFLIYLTACTGLSTKKAALNEYSQTSSKLEVEKKLQILVESAQKEGPKAIEFLAGDLFLKASSAHAYGDFVTASVIYKQLLKLKPDENFIKNKFAISLIRTGELEQAEKIMLEVFNKGKNKDEKAGLILAGLHTALNKSKEAKVVYEQVLKFSPASQDACVFLSKAYTQEKSFGKAIALLKKCEKHTDDKAVFAYYLGKVQLDKGDLKSAYAEFKRATQIDSSFTQAILALGLIHEEKGETSEAIKQYRRYLTQNPDDKMILSRIVQAYFSRDNYSEVMPYAERLIELEPDNLNLKVRLGIVYSDNKNFEKAIAIFKDILKISPKSDRVLYYLGALYQETQNWAEAKKHFSEIPKDSVLYQDSHLQIVQMMGAEATTASGAVDTKKVQSVINYINNKMDEIPEAKLELSIAKATFHESISQNAQAIATLEGVMEEKNFSESHRYYLASLYEKEKLFDKSYGLVNEILKKAPNNAQALNFIGYSLLERGVELDKAYQYITKAVKLSPKDGFIRDSLGWYYFKKGDYQKALKEITIAKKLVNDDPIITKHLAQVYQSMNKLAEAKNYYMEALKNCRFEHERAEIFESLNKLESERLPASQK